MRGDEFVGASFKSAFHGKEDATIVFGVSYGGGGICIATHGEERDYHYGEKGYSYFWAHIDIITF